MASAAYGDEVDDRESQVWSVGDGVDVVNHLSPGAAIAERIGRDESIPHLLPVVIVTTLGGIGLARLVPLARLALCALGTGVPLALRLSPYQFATAGGRAWVKGEISHVLPLVREWLGSVVAALRGIRDPLRPDSTTGSRHRPTPRFRALRAAAY